MKKATLVEDVRTKNLTSKKYFVKIEGSRKKSHKSYSIGTATMKQAALQSDIDNGLVKY